MSVEPQLRFRPRIDRLGGILIRLDRSRRRVFPDGWGDRSRIDDLFDRFQGVSKVEPVDVIWGRKEEHRGARVRKGSYASPLTDILPLETRAGVVELWSPSQGDTRVAITLPAWNEEGFVDRRPLARVLAAGGVSSLLIESPFYGTRRPISEFAQPIRTVADFMTLGLGTVWEALALVAVATELGSPGVTGYSMGGTLAALTSAVSPSPLATSPLAAAPSARSVVMEGMLRCGVRWSDFSGNGREELAEILDAGSVLTIPPRPHHRSAVLVGATADGFVPPAETQALGRHWGAEVRWVRAGHGSLRARHRDTLAAAVSDSFRRLSEHTS